MAMKRKTSKRVTIAVQRGLVAAEPVSKNLLRRLEITEAALHLLATEGVEATTLDLIGKRLGITRAHVAYYLKSKDALIAAVFQLVAATGQSYVGERLQSAVSGAEPGLLLKVYVEALFDWAREFPQHICVMGLLYHFCAVDPKIRKIHAGIRSTGRLRIGGIFKGLLDDHPAALGVAVLTQAALTGLLMEWATTEPTVEALERFKRLALDSVDTLLKLKVQCEAES